MRILQLCNKPPMPPIDGGSKAMHNITRGLLAAGHEVKVLCISTPKHPLDLNALPADYRRQTGIEGIFVDTSLNVIDAFTDLITADNYNISRFFSPDMDIRLIRLLSEQRFDIVHLESLFMTPYIATVRRYSQAPIVLRSHNLEHVLQERLATGERNPIKKPYRRYLAKQLKDYELAVLDRVDGVAAISEPDAAQFRGRGTRTPIALIPFGVAPNEYAREWPEGPLTFFHLGSMDWLPNLEGIHWLLEQVWPRVLRKHPKARLHLAGNKMPKDLLDAKVNGVTIGGRVDDADAFMAMHSVMVVPLFSAGGMRVKIIEGMAMGRAVISTHVGAEGIECTDGHDILLARTPAAFAEAMGSLIDEPARARALGRHALALVRERYSDQRVVGDLISFYRTLLKA